MRRYSVATSKNYFYSYALFPDLMAFKFWFLFAVFRIASQLTERLEQAETSSFTGPLGNELFVDMEPATRTAYLVPRDVLIFWLYKIAGPEMEPFHSQTVPVSFQHLDWSILGLAIHGTISKLIRFQTASRLQRTSNWVRIGRVPCKQTWCRVIKGLCVTRGLGKNLRVTRENNSNLAVIRDLPT